MFPTAKTLQDYVDDVEKAETWTQHAVVVYPPHFRARGNDRVLCAQQSYSIHKGIYP